MIGKLIDKNIKSILKDLIRKKIKNSTGLIKRIRKESAGSTILFYLILERLLYIAFESGFIILSKYILKSYLVSPFEDFPEGLYQTNKKSHHLRYTVHLENGVYFGGGLGSKVLVELGLTKTFGAYINYKICNDKDIVSYLSKNVKIPKISEKRVIETLYNELIKYQDKEGLLFKFKRISRK